MISTTFSKINIINPIRRGNTKVLALSNKISKKSIFWMLSSFLILFSGLYLYLVTQTIINTASFGRIEKNIALINSDLSELESENLALKKEINSDLVRELGFQEVADVKFVDRNNIGSQTLSLVKAVSN